MIWKRHETTSWSRNGFIVPCLSETLRRPPFASARHWLQFWLTVALHAANSEKPGSAGRGCLGLPCRMETEGKMVNKCESFKFLTHHNPSIMVKNCWMIPFKICITSIHWKSISNDNINDYHTPLWESFPWTLLCVQKLVNSLVLCHSLETWTI